MASLSDKIKFYDFQRIKKIFDLDFYLYLNTDIARLGLNGWSHWLSHGRFESRSVNPLIDFGLLDQVLPFVAPEYRLSEYLTNKSLWQKSICPFFPVRLEKSLLASNSRLSPIETVILDFNKYKTELVSCIDNRYQLQYISKFSKRFKTLTFIKQNYES
jgi:hypothetical protein